MNQRKKIIHIIAMLLCVIITQGAKAQKALALSWTGYAETNIKFSDFIKTSHTISFWCLMQFPNSYEGPVLAENGLGSYFVGKNDFSKTPGVVSWMVRFGSVTKSFNFNYSEGHWIHVAILATDAGNTINCNIYINGTLKGNLSYNKTDSELPQGSLRVGKRTTGRFTDAGRNGQFYGLVDDIVVYKTTLSESDITNLIFRPNNVQATPFANINFNSSAILNGSATLVNVSNNKSIDLTKGNVTIGNANKDGVGVASLPLPTTQRTMQLPFNKGEEWEVIQGVDDAGGSHYSYASFCWDFRIANKPQGDNYPLGTGGAPIMASAPGKVVTVRQDKTSGDSTSNLVEIQQGPGEVCAYLHIQKNSARVNVNDNVLNGQPLAGTGDVGANRGANHIHIAVTDKRENHSPYNGFVTFPVAFSNYQVKLPSITGRNIWVSVARGMPKKGQVIRIP